MPFAQFMIFMRLLFKMWWLLGVAALLFFLLLWPRGVEFDRPPRVGICTMVAQQPDFAYWLQHHLGMVDKIYLRIENSPDIVQLVQGDRRVYYETAEVDQSKLENNYFSQMDRQRDFVERMLEKAKQDSLDVLLHIDADELIAVRGSLADQLQRVPRGTASIHFQNHEAVFGANPHCFAADRFLDCQREHCTAYANGKSGAVLKHEPKYHGPHYFLGKTYEMPPSRALILHYDCCSFEQWHRKFERHAQRSSRVDEIPFPFYRDSIALIKSGASEQQLREFYAHHKRSPK